MRFGKFAIPDSSYIVGHQCFMKFRDSKEVLRTVNIWRDIEVNVKVHKDMMMVEIPIEDADLTLITPYGRK